MSVELVALVAGALLVYGLVSARVERSIVSAPLAFMALGFAVGPLAGGIADFDTSAGIMRTLAELTLVLVLFTDASRIDLSVLRRHHDVPIRLLGIGLPLTIILGGAVALVLLEALSFWEAAALAVILAPTDAALGQAVVTNERVPVRIRQALNVESSLNDGIALPALLIVLALAGVSNAAGGVGYWVEFIALQLVIGPAVGIAVGYVGGRLAEAAHTRRLMSDVFLRLSVLALAGLAFTLAEMVGGNGFIAAFAGGLTMGNTARKVCPTLWEFGEAEGQLLTLITFLLFGAALLPLAITDLTMVSVIYAVLSLTLIRMVPVSLSLIGTGMKAGTHVFLGWFGPRGLASILFALLIVDEAALAGESTILATVGIAVAFSVIAHGVSAYPGTLFYGRACERRTGATDPENREVTALPVRFRARRPDAREM